MEKISWTYHVRNVEVLHRVKEDRNIIHTVDRRKANWIGHNLCRNCLLEHVNEGVQKGSEDEEEDVSNYYMYLGKEKILEVEGGNTMSYRVEN